MSGGERMSSFFVLYALIGLGGCDSRTPAIGDSSADPMDALAAGNVSSEFDEAYWGEQRRTNPELWDRATAYCDGRDGTQYPNCRPVLSLTITTPIETAHRTTTLSARTLARLRRGPWLPSTPNASFVRRDAGAHVFQSVTRDCLRRGRNDTDVSSAQEQHGGRHGNQGPRRCL